MAAITAKLLSGLLILCIVKQGLAINCPGSSTELTVTYTMTGEVIHGQQEYDMTIANVCTCNLYNVVLSCPPFNGAETPDPTVIHHLDNSSCTINDGNLIHPQDIVKFKYAGPQPDQFVVQSYSEACS
ncbi:hypothetical protein AMTRI_Chr06g191790 [Amborella trichopoda]